MGGYLFEVSNDASRFVSPTSNDIKSTVCTSLVVQLCPRRYYLWPAFVYSVKSCLYYRCCGCCCSCHRRCCRFVVVVVVLCFSCCPRRCCCRCRIVVVVVLLSSPALSLVFVVVVFAFVDIPDSWCGNKLLILSLISRKSLHHIKNITIDLSSTFDYTMQSG
jgi:hypothetical protein